MWAIAAQHKKYNDSLSGYNSLKDPHLNAFFKKPQIRNYLIKANIISKENKIIEEISSTKHHQNVERKHKKELYHILGDLINQNEIQTCDKLNCDNQKQLENQENLIKYAKKMFNETHNVRSTNKNFKPDSSTIPENSFILQRLDRMVRAIKEYEHIRAHEHSPKDSHLESFSSHSSRDFRPKSSYGRQRSYLNTSHPDLSQNYENELIDTMKKSKSVINMFSYDHKDSNKNKATNDDAGLLESNVFWNDQPSCYENSVGRYHSKSSTEKLNKRLKNLNQQKVQMTLRYNGMRGASNRGKVKRNVKVFQQIAIGSNSIIIYDSFLAPEDIFSFEIRPHPNHSFHLNILVDNIREFRLNTCCEYRHKPGKKLSQFTLVKVTGGRPCFACLNLNFDIDTEQNISNNLNEDHETDLRINNYYKNDVTFENDKQIYNSINSIDNCALNSDFENGEKQMNEDVKKDYVNQVASDTDEPLSDTEQLITSEDSIGLLNIDNNDFQREIMDYKDITKETLPQIVSLESDDESV